MDIPKQVTEPSDNTETLLPTALPEKTEAPEANPYKISFEKYNNKLCEINNLVKNNGRKALWKLKEIGTKVCSRGDFEINNLEVKRIEYGGEYKKLYSKLDPGIEVSELIVQGTSRIFFFVIEPERILYIVAIKENHFEPDHVRR